jgi:hypothetical protein
VKMYGVPQARACGTPYIFTGPGLASCRRHPLSSNVRPQNSRVGSLHTSLGIYNRPMDVLYYWKKIEADLKNGFIGHFKSDKEKLQTLKDGYPNFIWLFKTPPGRLGEVQLLAKLAWTDKAPKGFTPDDGESLIYYEPQHPQSGRFAANSSESNVEETSSWMRQHFPAAVRAKFVGANGQQELRGEPLRQLQQIASTWALEPLV